MANSFSLLIEPYYSLNDFFIPQPPQSSTERIYENFSESSELSLSYIFNCVFPLSCIFQLCDSESETYSERRAVYHQVISEEENLWNESLDRRRDIESNSSEEESTISTGLTSQGRFTSRPIKQSENLTMSILSISIYTLLEGDLADSEESEKNTPKASNKFKYDY